MKSRVSRTALFRLLLGLALPFAALREAAGAVPLPTLEEITQRMGQAQSVFAPFVQERHLALFADPLRTRGFLCSEKPDQARWEVMEPYQSILVSNGTAVGQFERVGDQWQRLDLGVADAIRRVMTQITQLMAGPAGTKADEYTVTLRAETGAPVLVLEPRREVMRKMIRSIELHLDAEGRQPHRIVLLEQGGDRTEIRFEQVQINVSFPPRTFDPHRPEAIERVRAAVTGTDPPALDP